MQPMHIYVLGPDGAGRSALESTLARLGCTVSASDTSAGPSVPVGDVLMLDVRGDDSRWVGVAEDLHNDERPVMVVSEGATPVVRQLARRQAGTVLLTGGESDAGYRVALSVLQGLRERALDRAARGPRDDSLRGLAALCGPRGYAGRPSTAGARPGAGPTIRRRRPGRSLSRQRGEPQERRDGVVERLPAVVLSVRHARAQALRDQVQPHLVDGRLDGGELGEDLGALRVLLQHSLDAAPRVSCAAQAQDELFAGRRGRGRRHGAAPSRSRRSRRSSPRHRS